MKGRRRKINRSAYTIRKTHRYLGLFIGIQFIFWTVSGLYFSWTKIDEIHGDHFKNSEYRPAYFHNLISPALLPVKEGISSVELREINGLPYYWINNEYLFNAYTGERKNGINEQEALQIANIRLVRDLKVVGVKRIEQTDKHHEYRGGPLPAYVISYGNEDSLKAYVSQKDGKLQTVRHRSWRWFDFLWMTHTMDYESRDNFNTIILKAFSLLGLITVLSGFVLWMSSSRIKRKLKYGTNQKK